MSQRRGDQASVPTPAVSVGASSVIQEKLAARQAKRATKAAERRERSERLKEEGNAFYRDGDFQNALQRYQQAIDVHGPSQKPLLLTNLAATYLKLAMYPEAHDAADGALAADPKSIKARYRRAVARRHMHMWFAADVDFQILDELDPGNKVMEAEWDIVTENLYDSPDWEEDEGDYSDYEAPALEDDPELGESLSESSDCEHTGNNIPCKFYNRTECKNGHACRFSHAPDQKSERDALGRNVCRYYLMGVCKFGEQCSYLHSKEYLLQKGWWSTAECIELERKKYNFHQMLNKAIADYHHETRASQGQTSKKKQPKGKKKRGARARQGGSGSQFAPAPTGYSYSAWGGYDSDEDDGTAMCGFTGSEVNELISYGVKPWDDDAWDVIHAVHNWD